MNKKGWRGERIQQYLRKKQEIIAKALIQIHGSENLTKEGMRGRKITVAYPNIIDRGEGVNTKMDAPFSLEDIKQAITKLIVTYVTMVLWILDDRQRKSLALDIFCLAHAQVEYLCQQSHVWPCMTPESISTGVVNELSPMESSRGNTRFRVTKNSGGHPGFIEP